MHDTKKLDKKWMQKVSTQADVRIFFDPSALRALLVDPNLRTSLFYVFKILVYVYLPFAKKCLTYVAIMNVA